MKLILFEKSRVELEFNLYDKSPETLCELLSIGLVKLCTRRSLFFFKFILL